jgi:hypothetical protein
MDKFTRVSGHFGEQQGDAGQKKSGFAPVPNESTSDTDKLTDALFEAGINCEVTKVNWLKGTFKIHGSENYCEKARIYSVQRYPGSEVTW